MKFIISLIVTALLAFVAGLFLPWWSIAVAGFLIAIAIPQRPLKSFLSAFLALFLLWGGLAFWINLGNDGILLQRVASLFKLDNSSWLLFLITGIIGGLGAGLGALTGSFVRKKDS